MCILLELNILHREGQRDGRKEKGKEKEGGEQTQEIQIDRQKTKIYIDRQSEREREREREKFRRAVNTPYVLIVQTGNAHAVKRKCDRVSVVTNPQAEIKCQRKMQFDF